jgi:hypothetical protein
MGFKIYYEDSPRVAAAGMKEEYKYGLTVVYQVIYI